MTVDLIGFLGVVLVAYVGPGPDFFPTGGGRGRAYAVRLPSGAPHPFRPLVYSG